jgi:hypothetical protein
MVSAKKMHFGFDQQVVMYLHLEEQVPQYFAQEQVNQPVEHLLRQLAVFVVDRLDLF